MTTAPPAIPDEAARLRAQLDAVRALLAAYGAGESTPERTLVRIAAVLAPTH